MKIYISPQRINPPKYPLAGTELCAAQFTQELAELTAARLVGHEVRIAEFALKPCERIKDATAWGADYYLILAFGNRETANVPLLFASGGESGSSWNACRITRDCLARAVSVKGEGVRNGDLILEVGGTPMLSVYVKFCWYGDTAAVAELTAGKERVAESLADGARRFFAEREAQTDGDEAEAQAAAADEADTLPEDNEELLRQTLGASLEALTALAELLAHLKGGKPV